MKVKMFKKLIKECVKEAIKELNEDATDIPKELETSYDGGNTRDPEKGKKVHGEFPKDQPPLSPLQEALEHTRQSLTPDEVKNLTNGGTSSNNPIQEDFNFTSKDAKHFPYQSTTPIQSKAPSMNLQFAKTSNMETDMMNKTKAIIDHMKKTNKLSK